MAYRSGVAGLFWSRAKFENYFASQTEPFKITYFKIIIFAKQKKIVLLMPFEKKYVQFLTKFVLTENMCCFSTWQKRFKGRKNKLLQAGDSQNFLGKFVRFFVTLRCFYRIVIQLENRYFMIFTVVNINIMIFASKSSFCNFKVLLQNSYWIRK